MTGMAEQWLSCLQLLRKAKQWGAVLRSVFLRLKHLESFVLSCSQLCQDWGLQPVVLGILVTSELRFRSTSSLLSIHQGCSGSVETMWKPRILLQSGFWSGGQHKASCTSPQRSRLDSDLRRKMWVSDYGCSPCAVPWLHLVLWSYCMKFTSLI